MACLRLIWDRLIAGHSSCELRRHLDSVPPETPMREVVDRCRVWESPNNPTIHRISKPSTDLTYPTYVVGDADRNSENTRVAAVTGQRSGMTQLEDLLRRFLTPVESPALSAEVPTVEKLLQRLVTETQNRPPPGYESSSVDRVRADDAQLMTFLILSNCRGGGGTRPPRLNRIGKSRLTNWKWCRLWALP